MWLFGFYFIWDACFDAEVNSGIFKVYDNKGDGYLDREELMPAIEAAYKVSQCMDDLTGGEESPESRLERILSLMDPVSI